MVSPEAVYAALAECYDPCCAERGISVVDMGLVEDVRVEAWKESPRRRAACTSSQSETILHLFEEGSGYLDCQLDLPTPPGPVMVVSRFSVTRPRKASTSPVRPTNLV